MLQRLCYTVTGRNRERESPPGYAHLDANRAHIIRVLQIRAARERWEAAHTLVWAVENYLDICGYWTERVRTLGIGVKAAQALGHRRDEGSFLGNLGNAYAALGDMEKARACLQQALVIFEEIQSPYTEQARRQLVEL